MISIDGHNLTVFASDGAQIEPYTVQAVVMHPGESFDISVVANQLHVGDGNFWVRAQTLEVACSAARSLPPVRAGTSWPGAGGAQVGFNHTHEGRAILRYPGAPDADPRSEPVECTPDRPCTVLNCPFKYFPRNMSTTCVSYDEHVARRAAVFPSPAVR